MENSYTGMEKEKLTSSKPLFWKTFKRERLSEDQWFYLQASYVLVTLPLFGACYNLLFPTLEKGDLINPLQVLAQLSCFLLNLSRRGKRASSLLGLCFALSIISSLLLQGQEVGVLLLLTLFLLGLSLITPLHYRHIIPFALYFLDGAFARWAFYLAFQQVGYYALALMFESPLSTFAKRFSFLLLIFLKTAHGCLTFGEFYFSEPLRLAALLSGACIVFLSLAKRTTGAFLFSFLTYLSLSLKIGIMLSPPATVTFCGIPQGLLIFIIFHAWLPLGLFLFWEKLPKKKHALVPFFFSAILFVLPHFPQLQWLGRWVAGMDLLLFLLGLVSLLEGREEG